MYKLFFLCEFLGGSPASSIETEAAEFFVADELPELAVGRSTRWQICGSSSISDIRSCRPSSTEAAECGAADRGREPCLDPRGGRR